MADLEQHEFVIELEDTGQKAKALEYQIDSDYLTEADSWSCTLYNDDDPAQLRRDWLPLSRVKLTIDGITQLVGRIDDTESAGDGGTALRLMGRDYLSESVDGGADPNVKFTKGMDLGDAVLEVLKPYGIVTLLGNFNLTRDLVTGRDVFSGAQDKEFKEAKLSNFKIQNGMGAFEAANRVAARHGFTIQPTHKRDTVAIVRPQYGSNPVINIDFPDTRNALIGPPRVKRGYRNIPTVIIASAPGVTDGLPESPVSGQPGEYQPFGVSSPNVLGKIDDVKRVIGGPDAPRLLMSRFNPRGEGIAGNNGLLYRPFFYEDKDSRNVEQVEGGLRRELAERMKNVLTYDCSMQGHRDRDSGALYYFDCMAAVFDSINDIRTNMWCMARSVYNRGDGPKTDLRLVLPGALEL
jgi:hypothetical protein